MQKNKPIQTIANQIYAILRKNICDGLYTPGYWLQEADLCEQLGVSRSPVREALHRLSADGLLVNIPNKGTFVKEFTEKDIDEIFDMRLLLESYGIRNSRANLTSAHIQRLIEILGNLQLTVDLDDIDAYSKVDEQLHNEIVSLGANSLVSSTYYRVGSMNQQFRVLSLSVDRRFKESQDEHKEIIHTIIQGDTKSAENINNRHLEMARSCIKEQLKKKKTTTKKADRI